MPNKREGKKIGAESLAFSAPDVLMPKKVRPKK
jgi:hypothetical protein